MPDPELLHERQLRARFRSLGLILAGLLLLALAWSFSPLRELLDVGRGVAWLRTQGAALGLPGGTLLFALASMLAVPLTFLTILAALVYEPVAAYACCLLGACLGGAISHWLGAHLGAGFVRQLAGKAVARVSQRLGERGLLAVIVIRLLPAAPFAIVNMLIGASHIRLRDFILGTAIGMTPGVLLVIVFLDRALLWLGLQP